MVVLVPPRPAVAAGPSATARAGIIVDAATGEVLWERNADAELPPASTTKVLTAIVALESDRLGDRLTASPNAAATAPSKIGLRAGQRMRLGDLLFAVLLNSANDAATVVAEGLAGSEAAFAARMTARAREIGATGSRFRNAHGLTEPGHVSTARDMGLLFRHALAIPGFREILETRSLKVPVDGPGARQVSLRSHNRLLTGYVYSVIGKTGYTRAAKRCFVGSATHDGREVVIAFLGASDLWGDARSMFGWAFGEPVPTLPVVEARTTAPGRGAKPTSSTARRRSTRTVASASTRAARAEGDDAEERAGRYAVQVGPYKNRGSAEAEKTRLARRGYTASVSGKSVQLGSFSSRERARRFASRLKRSGYHPTVVAVR
jgi:D-alanyl-D-alanine carboxypeptidase (penicillin-binding protein 5/6)